MDIVPEQKILLVMDKPVRPDLVGRGAQTNPTNRFSRIEYVEDPSDFEFSDENPTTRVATEYYADTAQSIVSENDSPDVFFRYSVNPYRGCAHGCSYCYARPSHEYLGLSAGLDFESKIFVKEAAADLFRAWLSRKSYQPDLVMMSGVTDCYQPIERKLTLTRRCLEVAWDARQPMAIVTKNALVTRDRDLLEPMAQNSLASVAISLTSLDQSLTRIMEPRTSSPSARLRAIQELSSAGIPTRVMIAPIIPGLNDVEVPAILQAAAEAGARSASYVLLRLPLTVKPVFLEWLDRALPLQRSRIENRLRETRGGELYEANFGTRMTGRGEIADQIRQTFELFARKYKLTDDHHTLDTSQFRRPSADPKQLRLF